MSKFLYKMQNILDIKMKLEDQAKSSYREAKRAFDAEKEVYEMLLNKKEDYEKKLKQTMIHRLIVSDIKYYENCVEVIKDKIKNQELVVNQAKLEVSRKEQAMHQAMIERKTQEILREKKLTQFKMELKQQEEKGNDQLVSFKYNNNGEDE